MLRPLASPAKHKQMTVEETKLNFSNLVVVLPKQRNIRNLSQIIYINIKPVHNWLLTIKDMFYFFDR